MIKSGRQLIQKKSNEGLNYFFNEIADKINPNVSKILENILRGKELSATEGLELMKVVGADFQALIFVADYLRYRRVGDIVTYVVNRNINFTNICVGKCRFCAFRRDKNAPDAYMMPLNEIVSRAIEAWRKGATEVCIQGGLHPNVDANFYVKIIKAIKQKIPKIHIHGFSPMEIFYGGSKIGLSIKDTLMILREAGLDSIPGTAAEILDDDVRKVICPNKLDTKTWVELIKTAHRLGIPTTSTIMYGHIDSFRHRVNHIALLRDIQKDTGGFTEFVPLTFIHWNTPLYLEGEVGSGATGVDDLKMYAVSRLMLDGWIDNIQVSWVKSGPKFAQVALMAGANDFSGTLMEENISRTAGSYFGQFLPPEEIRKIIRSIGRVPAERTTLYKILKVYN
jgi:FO synthase subunit 2